MTESNPEYGAPESAAAAGSEAVREGEGVTLESRLRRLESILSSLENDEHTLDEALALFEEGIGHVRSSEKLLENAVLKVEELLDDEGTTRPLDGGES